MKAITPKHQAAPGSTPGPRRSRAARGFTLAEALFAAAVLSFVVAGLTQTIVSGQAQTYNALHEERALSLAESLMEEALALPYLDRGGDTTAGPDDSETTRDRFDGLDDFAGYAETAGALADPSGTLYPDSYQKFSRSVTAAYDTLDVSGFGGTLNGISIAVTVQDEPGREWTITRFVVEPAP